jgi:hypothetical protein
VGDDSHFVLHHKLLGEDGSVRWSVVTVMQPGLFSPKFGATYSHVFKRSPQNFAVEPGIHSLASWDRCFALPQLLYRRRHQSGIFWILPRMCQTFTLSRHSLTNNAHTAQSCTCIFCSYETKNHTKGPHTL